ncbi:hypothetical protein OFC24_29445, partial [Escherichia coli]|nr:hypothetical protein [Escherichia coli]
PTDVRIENVSSLRRTISEALNARACKCNAFCIATLQNSMGSYGLKVIIAADIIPNNFIYIISQAH